MIRLMEALLKTRTWLAWLMELTGRESAECILAVVIDRVLRLRVSDGCLRVVNM